MTEAPSTKGKKILILDDEPHVVTYLETLLRDNGYQTVSAANGKEGMEKVRSEEVDLVCLDISMPEQSGIRFYRDLKENPELSGIPVVVVTAVTGYGGDPEPFKRFLSTRKQVPPPEGFLAKPIDQREFLEMIAAILTGSAASRDKDT
jgi:two-component system cell cycle response regulator DivK